MPAEHNDRIRNAVSSFEEANTRLVRMLEGLNDEAAKKAPKDGGWSAAQVGYHVAMTNELFAGILAGTVALSQPAPAGFAENAGVFSAVPAKIETAPPLQPPAGTTRQDAVAKLRSAQTVIVGAIRALTADRATGHIMQLPFGPVSLYQAAEFLGPHTTRHIAQVERVTASS